MPLISLALSKDIEGMGRADHSASFIHDRRAAIPPKLGHRFLGCPRAMPRFLPGEILSFDWNGPPKFPGIRGRPRNRRGFRKKVKPNGCVAAVNCGEHG